MCGVLSQLVPEIPEELKNNDQAINKFYLNYSLMKICHKIARLGKDVQTVYNLLDSDGNGTLEPHEIVDGLTAKLFVFFSREQKMALIEYLDENNSGDVDFNEFKSKINYDNYHKNFHLYMTSFRDFIEILLEQWNIHKSEAFAYYTLKFKEFDDNSDGVLTFDEFEKLINNLDRSMARQDIITLFNETLEMDIMSTDLDKMNPECFCKMAFQHKLGGYGRLFFTDYILSAFPK